MKTQFEWRGLGEAETMKTFMIENNITLRNTIQILLTYHNTYPLLLIIAKRDFLTGYRRIVLLSHPTHVMNTKKDCLERLGTSNS